MDAAPVTGENTSCGSGSKEGIDCSCMLGSSGSEITLSESSLYMQVLVALQSGLATAVMHGTCAGDDVGMAAYHVVAGNLTLPNAVFKVLRDGGGVALRQLLYILDLCGHRHSNRASLDALVKPTIATQLATRQQLLSDGSLQAAQKDVPTQAPLAAAAAAVARPAVTTRATTSQASTTTAASTRRSASFAKMLFISVVKHSANGTGVVTRLKTRGHPAPDCITHLEQLTIMGNSQRAAATAGKDTKICTARLNAAVEKLTTLGDGPQPIPSKYPYNNIDGRGSARVANWTASVLIEQQPAGLNMNPCAEEVRAVHPRLRSTPRAGSCMDAPAACDSNGEPGSPKAAPSQDLSEGLLSADPKSCKSKKSNGHARKLRRHNKPEADAAKTPAALELKAEREERQRIEKVRESKHASPGI